MKKKAILLLLLLQAAFLSVPVYAQTTRWIDEMDLSQVEHGWGSAHARKSVGDHPITIAGTVYQHGVGTHAESFININLKGAATKFTAMVGVDDEATSKGSVAFI